MKTQLALVSGWIVGVVTTILGSWIASKIRVYHDNRRSHLEEIKEKVLTPLKVGVLDHFRPLVFNLVPMVEVLRGTPLEFQQEAAITESAVEQGDVLVGKIPNPFYYPLLDSILLADAEKRHYRKLMRDVDALHSDWFAHSGACHAWVQRIAKQIVDRSGLHSFPNRTGGRSYVMHLRLAVFLYKRLFRLESEPLRAEALDDQYWALFGESATLAVGTREEIDALVDIIDKARVNELQMASELIAQLGSLQPRVNKLIADIEYAVASRRLHGMCDLVRFF